MRFARQHLFIVLLLWLSCQQEGFAQPARQLANLGLDDTSASSLDPTLESPFNTKKYEFTTVKGIGYFIANDSIHGLELWRTDGTTVGTWMVVDLNPGEASSILRQLTAGENVFYFTGESTRFGFRLFRSDGTKDGTYPVRDERPVGTTTETLRYPLAVQGDQLHFSAALLREGNNSGLELWTTDGTRPGTRLVKEIGPGSIDGVHRPDRSRSLGAMLNGNVLFSGQCNQTEGFHLWKSDGTAAGTQQLKNLVPPEKVGDSGLYTAYPTAFVLADTLVYFAAFSAVDGEEWWRTDGTTEGTFILPQFAPEQGNSGWGLSGVVDHEFAVSIGHSMVYAMKRFEVNGSSYQAVPGIAYTDGTETGTKALRERLKMLNKPVRSAGKAWFLAQDLAAGIPVERQYGLWVATAEGCRFITAAAEGSRIMAVGNQVYCQNPNLGLQNIDAPTEQVLYGGAVWNPGNSSWSVSSPLLEAINGEPMHFGALESQLFFSYVTPESGREPWVTDGTPGGTRLLRDINQSGADGLDGGPGRLFLASAGTVYFTSVTPPNANRRLLRFSPEMNAPETVAGLVPAVFGANATLGYHWGQEVDGGIVFSADPLSDATNHYRAHIIRGNDIQLLTSADGVSYGVNPHLFTRAGPYVYFFAWNPGTTDAGKEIDLWRTAGTPETTIKLKSFQGSADTKFLFHAGAAVTAHGRFFFWIKEDFATSSYPQQILWSTDGTSEGTVAIGDYWFNIRSDELYPLGNGVMFKKIEGIWLSDGTPEGTGFFMADANFFLQGTMEFAGYHWFIAANEGGNGLWRTDGTVAGTHFVTTSLRRLSNPILFKGDIWLASGPNLAVLRASSLTVDQVALPESLTVSELLAVSLDDERLYFRGANLARGAELWRTDGTTAGTTMLQDINPGPNQSFPYRLRQIQTNLYFAAFDNSGLEPWIMPVSTVTPAKINVPNNQFITTGQPFSFQPVLISGSADGWKWFNLPPGLNYNPNTGAVTGVPQTAGTFQLTMDAINGGGTDIASFTLHVVDPDYARLSLTPMKDSPGQFTLSLDAIAGLRYEIQTSTDLVEWETVSSTSFGDFTLSPSTPEPVEEKRFYRVITLSPTE